MEEIVKRIMRLKNEYFNEHGTFPSRILLGRAEMAELRKAVHEMKADTFTFREDSVECESVDGMKISKQDKDSYFAVES